MFSDQVTLWPAGDKPAQGFCGEDERLAVLAAYGMDALEGDDELERIVSLAARICAAPIALVSIVEEERQRFLARTGIDTDETPRSMSFCAHAMLEGETMVVCDAREDPRFADNPLVTGDPHVRFYAGAPLVSSEGAPLGSLCVIDTVPREMGLTELQRETLEVLAEAVKRRLFTQRQSDAAIAAIARREAWLQHMLDSVPGIAWSADADGTFDYFNARWQQTGVAPPTVAEDWERVIHPDDVADSIAQWNLSASQQTPFEDEVRLRQADGSWRWVLTRAVPVVEANGTARWFGTIIDIDEQYREAEQRELLANELSHRIKNIFAVISGLIAIRARGREDIREFATELGSAIKALGLAHDYVRPVEGRKSERLLGLLRDLLVPYDGQNASGTRRVVVTGDDLPIGSRAATPLALIFHELATNSAKYGAFSRDDGAVHIHVRQDGDMARVVWDEQNVGAVGDAEREGFGSRLLRMAVEGQLGGTFERLFSEDGLDIAIGIPMKALAHD